jgi:hypothetical protein
MPPVQSLASAELPPAREGSCSAKCCGTICLVMFRVFFVQKCFFFVKISVVKFCTRLARVRRLLAENVFADRHFRRHDKSTGRLSIKMEVSRLCRSNNEFVDKISVGQISVGQISVQGILKGEVSLYR